MMRESLPYYEMTLWEEQRRQLLQWMYFLHAIITFRNHCVEQFGE